MDHHITIQEVGEGGVQAVCSCGWRSPVFGVLRAAEAEVLAGLPVRTHVSRAWLMTGTQAPGSWRLRATFPLGT